MPDRIARGPELRKLCADQLGLSKKEAKDFVKNMAKILELCVTEYEGIHIEDLFTVRRKVAGWARNNNFVTDSEQVVRYRPKLVLTAAKKMKDYLKSLPC